MTGTKPAFASAAGIRVTGPVVVTAGAVSWEAMVVAINAARVNARAVSMAIEERRIRRVRVSGISFGICDR
jgi:hypothetical protein